MSRTARRRELGADSLVKVTGAMISEDCNLGERMPDPPRTSKAAERLRKCEMCRAVIAGHYPGLQLLLVVDRSAGELLALRIGSGDRDGAGLAVGRDDTTTGNRNLVALLVGERQGMIVDSLIGPRIRTRIPCDRVVFAVKLAGPLVVCRLTVAVGTIHADFHAVSSGLVDNCGVLRRTRTDLGLGLVQLPGAQKCVGGEAHGHADKAQCQSQNSRSCFHIPSGIEKRMVGPIGGAILALGNGFGNS